MAMLLAMATVPTRAQDGILAGQFPVWAERAWQALSRERSIAFSMRLNPFVWRGEFDGDSRPDLAVLVVERGSGKEGIAFLLQGRPAIVVGAGEDFGNGGDDFAWMDLWRVEERGTRYGGPSGQASALAADALMVAREGSASALIHFVRGRPRWHQQGD